MAGSPTPPSVPAPRRAEGTAFDTVLRGYDRRQVDDFLRSWDDEVAQRDEELAELRRRLERADGAIAESERALRTAPSDSGASGGEGFGIRAEKILRLAEQEAADARGQATRESAAIIQAARTEAEQHRHEVESGLIARATHLEQQTAQRQAELKEREEQINDQLAAGRAQVEQLQAAATLAADQRRKQAEADAEDVRARAARDAAALRHEAEREVARLTELRSGITGDLVRLTGVLSNELRKYGPYTDEIGDPTDTENPGIPSDEHPGAGDDTRP